MRNTIFNPPFFSTYFWVFPPRNKQKAWNFLAASPREFFTKKSGYWHLTIVCPFWSITKKLMLVNHKKMHLLVNHKQWLHGQSQKTAFWPISFKLLFNQSQKGGASQSLLHRLCITKAACLVNHVKHTIGQSQPATMNFGVTSPHLQVVRSPKFYNVFDTILGCRDYGGISSVNCMHTVY